MEGGGKLHGGREVLFGGRDAKGGFSERRAAEHLGDDGATAFHGGRCTGGVGEDIDQPLRRKIERLADGEGLAERLPVNEEREIDRELQRRARTERAYMFDPSAKLLEQGFCVRDIGFSSADETKQLAFFRRARAAADRAFDKARAQLRYG